MVFELFGIPGSGKSYICTKLEKDRYVRDIMSFYKENFIGKILFHIFIYLFKVNKKLRKKYYNIIQILGDTSVYNNTVDSSISIELYIKYMIFIYFVENIYSNDKNIIIDEGIIHYCIVLYAEFSVELNKIEQIIKELKIYNKKIIILGLNCDRQKAIFQMKKRNRKRTAIDFLEDMELEKVINIYLEAVNYFSNRLKYLSAEEIENEIRKVLK